MFARSSRKCAFLAHLHSLDHIRPDWEAKLAAVRATATRRANRRIIMRQVGDRLIPVGVTSGRVHPLAGEVQFGENGDNANENEGRGSRRSRRRQPQQQPQDLNQLLGTMGLGGQDLEEVGFLTIIFSNDDTQCCLVDDHGGYAPVINRTGRTTAKGGG